MDMTKIPELQWTAKSNIYVVVNLFYLLTAGLIIVWFVGSGGDSHAVLKVSGPMTIAFLILFILWFRIMRKNLRAFGHTGLAFPTSVACFVPFANGILISLMVIELWQASGYYPDQGKWRKGSPSVSLLVWCALTVLIGFSLTMLICMLIAESPFSSQEDWGVLYQPFVVGGEVMFPFIYIIWGGATCELMREIGNRQDALLGEYLRNQQNAQRLANNVVSP